MNEYRVKVTVRNNLLLSAIEEAGYKSQSEFARAAGLNATEVNSLVAMRKAPIGTDGAFIEPAKVIMEVLGACPTDLWTEEQLTTELRRNTVEKELSREAVMMALEMNCQNLVAIEAVEKHLEEDDFKRVMNDTLDSLTPRESKILRLRFGLDMDEECTSEKIGSMFDITKSRIGQIEAKALRKMRHPSRSDNLKQFLEEE